MDGMVKNERILIVGGSSGIGLAVAKLAMRHGAHVHIASRNCNATEGGARLSDLPEESVEMHALDITSSKEHGRLLDAIGAIDHLIIAVRPETRSAPFQSIEVEAAKQAFETKFWGAYQFIQAAGNHIRETGSITLTSGIAGEKIYKGASTMALINSATETLCRVLAVELAPIRVNAVSPGFVEPKPEPVREYVSQCPVKRLASLDEIASAYLWLMQNRYVTGTVTVIDGGARLI
jgi:NAD(P)-dependent dehydrogenase (short-subunit alcohol dehydrogenase family)